MPIPVPDGSPRIVKRVVVCAANRYGTHIFIGIRHWCGVMRENMQNDDIPNLRAAYGEEQGFIDQYGVFMDREEAWKVAANADQIKYRCGGDTKNGGTLYSENLY